MKTFLNIILTILLLTQCRKDDVPDFQTDKNGVIILQPYQWKSMLHENGVFHSNGYIKFPIIYNMIIRVYT